MKPTVNSFSDLTYYFRPTIRVKVDYIINTYGYDYLKNLINLTLANPCNKSSSFEAYVTKTPDYQFDNLIHVLLSLEKYDKDPNVMFNHVSELLKTFSIYELTSFPTLFNILGGFAIPPTRDTYAYALECKYGVDWLESELSTLKLGVTNKTSLLLRNGLFEACKLGDLDYKPYIPYISRLQVWDLVWLAVGVPMITYEMLELSLDELCEINISLMEDNKPRLRELKEEAMFLKFEPSYIGGFDHGLFDALTK
jgi:hypothetical protein